MGLKADPEAAKKAAAEAAASKPAPTPVQAQVAAVAALPLAAQKEIEEAPKAYSHVETEDDKTFAKAAQSGDFSYLETKWEEFNEKAIKPGEDDDEEDGELFDCLFIHCQLI